MTEQEIQDYRDAVRYLLRVYLVTTMTTNTEFAHTLGLHHKTVIEFDRGSNVTRLHVINKIEEYLRSKFANADELMKEGVGRKTSKDE
jgi:hypothetical protein